MATYHYYAFDAAQLLETCIDHLQEVVELDTKGSHSILYELKEGLLQIESVLRDYFLQIIQDDTGESTAEKKPKAVPSLADCMSSLRATMEQTREEDQAKASSASSTRHQRFSNKSPARHIQTSTAPGVPHHTYSSSRNLTDTLLFRLIVALQLCIVRIDDAHFVIAACRRQGTKADQHRKRWRRKLMANVGYCGGILGVTAFLLRKRDTDGGNSKISTEVIQTLAKVGAVAFLGRMTVRTWKTLWMTSKLDKTMMELMEWQRQWMLVHSDRSTSKNSPGSLTQLDSNESGDAGKAEILMEYARQRNPNNKV